jgi:hypothetical protein
MKLFAFPLLFTSWLLAVVPVSHLTNRTTTDSIKQSAPVPFTEGVLYTRVSFPGNILNEALSKIDFEKGNVKKQLEQLQKDMSSSTYAARAKAQLETMSLDERATMGTMLMAAMMSPLYAKINYAGHKVLANAVALNYSMQSYMDNEQQKGKMVVQTADRKKEAAIEFSAGSMRQVWEKEAVDEDKYEVKNMPDEEMVAGYKCNRVSYTYKPSQLPSTSPVAKPAYKLIVSYSPDIDKTINFLHPFYFQLDKGILKVEVHYDKAGKNRMVYEVTRVEPKKMTQQDFEVTDVKPVVNWDANPAIASMNILSVMMGSD